MQCTLTSSVRNYSKPKMTASNNKNKRANNSKGARKSKDKATVKAGNKDNMAVKADNRAETSKKASSKDKEETVSNKVAVKANSRTRWMLIVMEMHPVRVIPEDSKVKSQQKTTDKRQQTKVSHWHMKSIVWLRPWATKGMS